LIAAITFQARHADTGRHIELLLILECGKYWTDYVRADSRRRHLDKGRHSGRENPDLHIYHYNHYEVTALRRLMGKYGVCEQETEELLRGQVFVNLYRIVRQAVVAVGEPSRCPQST
jgi:predicted RecB family nuclease